MSDSKMLAIASTQAHIDDAHMVIHNHKVNQRYHLSNVVSFWLSVLLFGGLNIYFFWTAIYGDFTVFHAMGHAITVVATIIVVRKFSEDVKASRCILRGSSIEYNKVFALRGDLSPALLTTQQGELSANSNGDMEIYKDE